MTGVCNEEMDEFEFENMGNVFDLTYKRDKKYYVHLWVLHVAPTNGLIQSVIVLHHYCQVTFLN